MTPSKSKDLLYGVELIDAYNVAIKNSEVADLNLEDITRQLCEFMQPIQQAFATGYSFDSFLVRDNSNEIMYIFSLDSGTCLKTVNVPHEALFPDGIHCWIKSEVKRRNHEAIKALAKHTRLQKVQVNKGGIEVIAEEIRKFQPSAKYPKVIQ